MKHDILEGTSNKSSFPGSALFANSNPKKCVFRQSVDHYSDKCNIVTEIDKRRQLLKSNRLCFNCLRGGHTKKNCRNQMKCFKCKTESHHTALCNPLQKQTQSYVTDDSSTNLVKSNTLILLQTANAIVTDEKENQCCAVKILLDPRSQQIFITQRAVKELKLKPLCELNMGVRGVLSHREGEMKLKEYEIRLLPMSSKENYLIKVLSVPRIYSKIKGQNLNCVIKNHNFIRDLQLAGTSFNGEANVDILIGADLYWKFVTEETKQSESCNVVAINFAFGWLISALTNASKEITI